MEPDTISSPPPPPAESGSASRSSTATSSHTAQPLPEESSDRSVDVDQSRRDTTSLAQQPFDTATVDLQPGRIPDDKARQLIAQTIKRLQEDQLLHVLPSRKKLYKLSALGVKCCNEWAGTPFRRLYEHMRDMEGSEKCLELSWITTHLFSSDEEVSKVAIDRFHSLNLAARARDSKTHLRLRVEHKALLQAHPGLINWEGTILQNIQSHSVKVLDARSSSYLVTKAGLVEEVVLNTWLLSPGPRFDPRVSFCGTVGSKKQFELNLPCTPNPLASDDTYYTRVAILSQHYGISGSIALDHVPSFVISTASGNSKSTVLKTLSKERREIAEMHLPVADALALFSVHDSKKDVAAVHLRQVRTGEFEVRLAKNTMDIASEERAQMLLAEFQRQLYLYEAAISSGLSSPNPAIDETERLKPLMSVVLRICGPKIKYRAAGKGLKWESLSVVADTFRKIFAPAPSEDTSSHHSSDSQSTEGSMPARPDMVSCHTMQGAVPVTSVFRNTFGSDPNAGDTWLCSMAANYEKSLPVLTELLFRQLSGEGFFLKKLDGNNVDELWFYFSAISALRTSNYVALYTSGNPDFGKWAIAAKKLSCYIDGVKRCWNFVAAPVRDGKSAFRLSLRVLQARSRTTPCQTFSLHEAINSFIDTTEVPGVLKKPVTQEVIGAVFPLFDLRGATISPVPYHCELQISDLLDKEGEAFACIGVSKFSCYTCGAALEAIRVVQGREYYTSGAHGKVFRALLPDNEQIREAMKRKVDILFGALVKESLQKVTMSETNSPQHDGWSNDNTGELVKKAREASIPLKFNDEPWDQPSAQSTVRAKRYGDGGIDIDEDAWETPSRLSRNLFPGPDASFGQDGALRAVSARLEQGIPAEENRNDFTSIPTLDRALSTLRPRPQILAPRPVFQMAPPNVEAKTTSGVPAEILEMDIQVNQPLESEVPAEEKSSAEAATNEGNYGGNIEQVAKGLSNRTGNQLRMPR
ncbi:hypothetical protein BJ508DRAFT_311059 [Ascobolus immersus RN42]|uniref:Uncharacterized protein n=1 Tax=Ascobolus immersus RN42 TaxID=1160509 RepID=A0A3N4I3J7_ASCIM|nr:hypothetical protein BJ508DRAFT_311059 [Ascobolus immersus RN42]